MSPAQAGFAILVLGVALVIGKLIRLNVRWVQRVFLPSSIVAGFVLMFLGPWVLGRIAGGSFAAAGIFTPEILRVWSALPGLLISVVFATMFLGQKLPNPRKAAQLVGPQLSFGVAFGAGQYVVGILLAVLLLTPVFGTNPLAAALIEISFEGGHGTAAGMRPIFNSLGWEAGADLAVGLATLSLLLGVILGVAWINWGVRTGKTEILKGSAQASLEEQRGLFRKDEYFAAGRLTTQPASVEPLSLHVAFTCLAILIGWVMLELLRWLEQLTIARIMISDGVPLELFRFLPLFPMAMLGGVIVQRIARALGFERLIDHQMMLRIQGLALDFLVVAAIASLSLGAIQDNLAAFVIMAIAGTVFNTFLFFWLAPRLIGRYWFERAIADYGQSMGVTATGLMLLRITDPEMQSPAYEA
ncbi:MAG: sodium:glutamate symporter, partial [Cellulomonadaceae bacterium]|nr:sodium:glutamate symporter [Cellulomonadaceae bacterium]